MQFTHEQLEVIEAPPEGNMLVLANAGSGKTGVLVERVARLINRRKCEAFEVCVLTFTNAAAAMLQSRLSEHIGSNRVAEMSVGTFHSVAARMMCEGEEGVKINKFANVDEVLVLFLRMLETSRLQGSKRGAFTYVFIDESQDLNELQANVVLEMANSAKQVMLTGDDDQSIYAFRGASPRFLFELATKLCCQTTFLSVNHRASPELVALANSVSANNKSLRGSFAPASAINKPPATASPRYKEPYFSPKKPWVVHCSAEYQEFDFVCNTIAHGLKTKLVEPHNVCVLSRSAKALHAVHAQFRRGRTYVPVELTVSRVDEFNNKNKKKSNKTPASAVSLSTMHGAKGLEFMWVFVLNVSSFHFPDVRVDDLEEERRLFYVSVTRAQNRLWLIGNTHISPSLFLAELEPTSYYHVDSASGALLHPVTQSFPLERVVADYDARKEKTQESVLTRFSSARQLISMIDGVRFLELKDRHFIPGWSEAVEAQLKEQSQPQQQDEENKDDEGWVWPAWVDVNFLRNDVLKFWQLMFVKMTADAARAPCNIPLALMKLIDADGGWKKLKHAPGDFHTVAVRAAQAYADPGCGWRSLFTEVWTLVTLAAVGHSRHILWSLDISNSDLMDLMPHCLALEQRLLPKLKGVVLSNHQVVLRDMFPWRIESIADMDFAHEEALVNFVPLSLYGQQDSLINHLTFGHFQAAQCVHQGLRYTKIVFLDLEECTVFELNFKDSWTKEQAFEFLRFVSVRK